jgi:pimeloyl-ACP methyl ester carboxylesterase
VRSLLLNDNGPSLAAPAIARIRQYAGTVSSFATVMEFEQYLRTIYKPFGALTDAQWRAMAETSLRRLPDGRITSHYDPAITRQFVVKPDDYELWPEYDRLELPVLCLRGAESDLLLRETVDAMAVRGPRARIVTIEGCGHAPALMDDAQIGLVRGFLEGDA